MEFEVKKEQGRCRRGVLVTGSKAIETPACFLYSRCGAVPHVVREMLEDIDNLPEVVQLTLPSIIEQPGPETVRTYTEHGIAAFLGLEDFVTYLSIQDPSDNPRAGYNEEKAVSVWTAGGRKKIDINQFVQVVAAYKPTIAESLCDTIPADGQTSKRIRKSVDRTLKFLDEYFEATAKKEGKSPETCHIFGAVQGSDSEKERMRSAQETAKRPVSGFVVEGFEANKGDWISLLQCTMDELPKEKPRVIHGMGRPDQVIQAIECGIDLFDSSFPHQVTERGCALNLRPKNKRLKPELSYDNEFCELTSDEPSEHHELSAQTEQSRHDPPKTRSEKKLVSGSAANGDKKQTEFEINLNDACYKCDFNPLVTGCTCYSCMNHTRAYLHHLLLTKEMLAQVLLMMHNFQEYFCFFEDIQRALSGGYLEDFKKEFLRS